MAQPKQIPTRMACFALISALEEDVRDYIRHTPRDLALNLIPPESREKAMRRSGDEASKEVADELELLDYCDFSDLAAILKTLDQQNPTRNLKETARRIEGSTPSRNRVCHSRPLEPDDFPNLLELTDFLLREQGEIPAPTVGAVRQRLVEDPTFAFELVIPEYWNDAVEPKHNLPIPEFDDTGFLGRQKDRTDVLKLLQSPYPVITLVGEGGVGKTALALRCLYDLVERGDKQPYEAIIWISLRTSLLTLEGTREIKDAIKTVLGLFQEAARELGAPNADRLGLEDLQKELIEYLGSFKVLLAIDNLETVDVASIRPLLVDIPAGSKVLLTSRIGLGELEVRYPLEPLEKPAALHLARRFAQSINLKQIYEAPDELLGRYVDALYRNPLLIKWFISGVSSGLAPATVVFGTQKTFEQAIAFCFENLFERLSPEERFVLQVFGAAMHALSRAELLLLTEMAVLDLDRVLIRLHNSSMLRRTSSRTTQQYSLTDIAAAYLRKVSKPDAELVKKVHTGLASIRLLAQQELASRAAYKYDRAVVEWSGNEELIATSFLKRALTFIRAEEWQEARDAVERARELTPAFSEVYRIDGWVQSRLGDLHRAAESFRQCVDLAPTSARARYSYGWFLLEDLKDLEGALAEFTQALKIDNDDRTLLTARAICLVRLGRFDEAEEHYKKILATLDARPAKWRLATRDQATEFYKRRIELDRSMRDHRAMGEHLLAGAKILGDSRRLGDWDAKMQQTAVRLFGEVVREWRNTGDQQLADAIVNALAEVSDDVVMMIWSASSYLQDFAKENPDRWELLQSKLSAVKQLVVARPDRETQQHLGIIDVLWSVFGFIKEPSGDRWFFHESEVRPREAFQSMSVGDAVKFEIGSNQKGPCAQRVEPME